MIYGFMLSGLAAAMFAAQLQPGNSGGPLTAKGPEQHKSGEVCPVHPAATAAKPGSANTGSGNLGSFNSGSGNLGSFNSGSGNLGSGNSGNNNVGGGTITDSVGSVEGTAAGGTATQVGSDKNIIDGNRVPSGEVGEAGRDHIIIRDEAASAPQVATSTAKPSDCVPKQSDEAGVGDTRQDLISIMCDPGETGPFCG